MKKLFPAWLLLGALPLHGQMANNSAMQLHSGASMRITNTFSNESTAALVNNGSLYLTGNLVNNQSSMAAGAGSLFLIGTSAQTVSGTQIFKTYNLNSNNSSGITLNNDLSITNVHTFTNGNIITSATPNYLSYEAGSSYTGSTDSRHVIGWVKKSGTTDFSFPVGNSSYLRSIDITNLSTNSVFTAQYAGATTNTNNLNGPLVMVNPNEHWEINKISGGTAQVAMNWDNSKIAFPNWRLTDIRTAQYTTQWNNTGGAAIGSATSTGSITSNTLSTFGKMTLASSSFVLPVRFVNIFAERLNNTNRITWITAEEEQVDHYEVQRQLGSNTFVTIGSVRSKNNPSVQQYQFDDADPLEGKIFYRVKNVDNNGAFSYSKIVSVTINNASKMVLLQNPVGNSINLMATALPAARYSYQILSENGQVVQQGLKDMSGSGLQYIPVRNLPRGNYLLTIFSNRTDPFITKIIKQ